MPRSPKSSSASVAERKLLKARCTGSGSASCVSEHYGHQVASGSLYRTGSSRSHPDERSTPREHPPKGHSIVDHGAMHQMRRWLPGRGATQRLEPGWMLADGERWDAESEGADLASLHLMTPRTLTLEFRSVSLVSRPIAFANLAELRVDGDLQWTGESDLGWEVLGTSMLTTPRPRGDGLVVYTLELPQVLMCFTSAIGRQQLA